MANQWFKFYGGEFLSDPKISSLTPIERSCWITLLCLASLSTEQGSIEYLTVEALLQKSGVVWDPYHPEDWEKSQGVLTKLERMRMITTSDDGIIKIVNWKKRQETNLTNAERQARYRGKQENSNSVSYESNARSEEKRREEKRSENSGIIIPSNTEIRTKARELAKLKKVNE